MEIIFFQHEILPWTQLHPACFLAWTDRNCPEENRDFSTPNFPTKRETLHPIHVFCIANIYSLDSLCEAIFSSSVFFSLKAPSFWVHCDLNVLFLTGSDGCLSSRLSLPVRSPSTRKRLHLKFPNVSILSSLLGPYTTPWTKNTWIAVILSNIYLCFGHVSCSAHDLFLNVSCSGMYWFYCKQNICLSLKKDWDQL